MAAVARPRFDHVRNKSVARWKIRNMVWPFVKQVEAKRNSKNRFKGTIETKPDISIDKSMIKNMLINNVFPAIRQKFPVSSKSWLLFHYNTLSFFRAFIN